MLIGFFSIGLISLLTKIYILDFLELFSSLGYFLRFLIYMLPLLLLPRFIKKKENTLLVDLVLVGFIFVILGIVQYLFLPQLEHLIFLGEWDIHSYRLFSTFFDPNYAGLFITFEIILILGLFKFISRNKIVPLIMLIFSYISLFLTYSRSSILAMFVGLLVYLILMKQYKIIFIFSLVFILSFFSLVLFSNQFAGEGVKIFRTVSIHTRLESFSEGFSVFKQNPIIGSGFNSYKYARKNFSDLKIYEVVSNASNAPSNSFIFILATTGVIGAGFFCGFSVLLFRKYFFLLKTVREKGIPVAVISCLVALFVHSIFQNSLFFSPIVTVYVLILVGGLGFNYSRE